MTAREALENYKNNRCSRWHEREAKVDETGGQLGFQRLNRELFVPGITPEFKLRRDDKLFAIGSCFARGIEMALLALKMEVVSAASEFASMQPARAGVTGLGFTNKYNTFSIYNELRWALDPEAASPRESIVDVGDGLFCDPHINPALELAGWEETLRRRSIIEMVNRRITQCRVVIMTLGLVEVWRDLVTGLFVNTTPIPPVLRSHPERYEFGVTNFAQNFENLEKIHALLCQFGHPDFQIVVTVSPVPLMATFSGKDVVIANTYSKSLLRTAAQEWAAAHENVHYFPSYEIVQNSQRSITWAEDLRHVHGKVVNHIMRIFRENYLAEETIQAAPSENERESALMAATSP